MRFNKCRHTNGRIFVYMKAIAYYRVSTQKQGRSGLGLEAQQFSAQQFCISNQLTIIGERTDVESGKKSDNRPQLQAAIEDCKRQGAILVIAKLDRLSRNVAFIANLLESKVPFKCVDMPNADSFMIHIMAAVAQRERENISQNTKDRLAAAKRRGVELGKHGKVLAAKNKAKAIQDAKDIADRIDALRIQGITSVRGLAAQLGKHPKQMQRILARLK